MHRFSKVMAIHSHSQIPGTVAVLKQMGHLQIHRRGLVSVPPPPRGEFSWQKPLLLMGTVTSISLHAFAGFCTLGGSVQTLGSREGDGNSQMAKELACADSFSFSTMVATSQYSHYCVFAFCSRIIMRAYVQFAGSQQIAACFFSAHTHLLRALGVS